jgi:peptidyl-prolyl cis-trans isomerase D
MLSFLRQRKRSWIITLLLGIIVFTFILYFGGSDWSRSAMEAAVEVNGEKINPLEVEMHYQRALEAYRELFKGSLTPEMIENLNLRATVIDELIQRRILLQEAERLGLSASDDEVVDAITGLPVFQVAGRFSKERYLDVLRYRRMTPVQFETEQKEEIAIRKLLETIRDSVHVSESELSGRYLLESENINLNFVRLSADDFRRDVQVSAEEVKSFYERNMETLKEPLRVQVEYLAYPFARFSEQVQVSQQEAENFYRDQREKRFFEPKAARVRHILLRVPEGTDKGVRLAARQKADKVLTDALQGADFAGLAKQFSEDPSRAAGGEVGWVTPGQLLPPLETAVFALKKGELSEVLESPFGFHIFKVEDVKGERTKPFDEVKGQILIELKRERGKAEAGKAIDQDREKLMSGTELSQLAKDRGLQPTLSGLFAREEGLPAIGSTEEFYNKAFTLPVKEISSPIEGADAYYLMRVVQRKEPVVPEFDSVKSRIEDTLKGQKAFETALHKANDFLARLKKDKDLIKLARQDGLEVEETGWFPRNVTEIPKVGPLQELKTGGIAVSEHQPLADRIYTQPNVAYVFLFKESREADPKGFEKDKNRRRAQVLAQKQEDALRKFIEALKARASIKVPPDLVTS